MNRFPKRKIVLHLATLPWDLLVAWPAILLLYVLWGTGLRFRAGVLSTEFRPDSWPMRTWYKRWGATTLGHAIFFRPDRRSKPGEKLSPVEVHEHVHVEQHEAACLKTFLIGTSAVLLGAPWWFGLAVWTLGYPLMALAGVATAWLRGEPPYRGAHYEQAAYAIESVRCGVEYRGGN